jgi:Initiation factor 2 subunit family
MPKYLTFLLREETPSSTVIRRHIMYIPSTSRHRSDYHRGVNGLYRSPFTTFQWRSILSSRHCIGSNDGKTTFCASHSLLRDLQIFRRCAVGQFHQERARSAFFVLASDASDLLWKAPVNHLFSSFPLNREKDSLLLSGGPNLEILHPLYDLTPPASITAVVTEVGLIPPSSISSIPFALGRQTL